MKKESQPATSTAQPNAEPLPFADIMADPAQQRLLYEAEEAAVAECMKSRGFEYESTPYVDDQDADGWAVHPSPGDVELAGLVGYGVADSIESANAPPPAGPNDARLSELSSEQRAAWETALFGAPIDPSSAVEADDDVGRVSIPNGPTVTWNRRSCFAEARRALHGDDRRYVQLRLTRDGLLNEMERSVEEDPAYLSRAEEWKTCMMTRGFDYQGPRQAATELRAAYDGKEISLDVLRVREVDVATADAECFHASGLAQARAEAQRRYEALTREERPEVLAELEAMHESSVERAQRWVRTADVL